MSGKSIEYWRTKFERFSRVNPARHHQLEKEGYTSDLRNFGAARKLLLEYSATYYNPKFGTVSGGGWCSRFWAGRWGIHHGKEVRATLRLLYGRSSEVEQTIHYLIKILKKNLAHQTLRPDGDLSRILEVIKEKTGVSFQETEVHSNDHSRPFFKK